MNKLNKPDFLLNNKIFQTIYGRNLLSELNIIIPNETFRLPSFISIYNPPAPCTANISNFNSIKALSFSSSEIRSDISLVSSPDI